MKRERSPGATAVLTSSITRVFTLAVSVTMASGAAASAATTAAGTAPIGVATMTSSATRTASSNDAAAVSRPTAAAADRMSGLMSQPTTWAPARRAASAIDVPISPVPMMATRRSWGAGSGRGIEVVPQALGPVEVDVADLAETELGVEVCKDPHDRRHGSGNRDLAGAEQRDVAEADATRGFRRERAREIFGGREQDADQVVVRDRVPREERLEQLGGRGVEAGRVVAGHDDRPPGGAHVHRFLLDRSTMRPVTGRDERLQGVAALTSQASFRAGDESPEVQQLIGCEVAVRARSKPPEPHGPDAHAQQPGDRELKGLEHAAYLSLASLGHHDRELRSPGPGVDDPYGARPSRTIVKRHAGAQGCEVAPGGRTGDLDQVFLLDLVPRMGERVGEVPVVHREQQALALEVEPADGEHAGAFRGQQ